MSESIAFRTLKRYQWATALTLLMVVVEALTGNLLLGTFIFLGTLFVLPILPLLYYEAGRWVMPAVVAALVGLAATYGLARYQNWLTERRANMIVEALETYRRQQQNYPDSLARLVPAVLPAAPATGFGWSNPSRLYYQADSTHYTLSYQVGFTNVIYTSANRAWTKQGFIF